ncbi:MAG: DUF4760 domain-containing protein [Acidimicrobiia bacterium]
MNDSNWQVVSAIASVVSAAGILAAFIALILARNQLKEARAARLAEMTVELSRRWDDDKIVEARQKVSSYGDAEALCRKMKKLRANKSIEYYEVLREPNLLEDLGVLVNRKGLEFGVIQDSLGELVVQRWPRGQPTIEWLRDRPGQSADTSIYRFFELLAVAIAFPAPVKSRWWSR